MTLAKENYVTFAHEGVDIDFRHCIKLFGNAAVLPKKLLRILGLPVHANIWFLINSIYGSQNT